MIAKKLDEHGVNGLILSMNDVEQQIAWNAWEKFIPGSGDIFYCVYGPDTHHHQYKAFFAMEEDLRPLYSFDVPEIQAWIPLRPGKKS